MSPCKSRNTFCVVCGKYLLPKNRRNFTDNVKQNYGKCFNIPTDGLNNAWTPRVICIQCHSSICNSVKGVKNAKRFSSPMFWQEPFNHQTDCYFCLCKTTGYNTKNKKAVEYPNVQSVTFSLPITQNKVNLNNHRESDNSEGSESEIQSSRHDEWCLFIDSSTRSLKGVLLHNDNVYAPIAHSVVLNEEYENLQFVLMKLQYDEHKWQLCGDLKIMTIMLG